ncbi:hypothetical protein LXM50_13290 [Microbacterium sp. Au-Mic1]|uniref:hypothetical protein n=1 Tax=Microbacterium sp. Au-Mic1 TaxID=2906457 RepID=UPI001E4169AD|nr:hypothetical protein [Microbacterium sp. Au-Mic1]MCE4026947.1 hypothetical protein [Microbacterium sp. Au-Mic1]
MQDRSWMPADTAMWHTCRIAYELESGLASTSAPIATMFPLVEGETAIAAGPLIIDEYKSAGDGSYQSSTFLAGGTGVFGLALLAATATASAAGNANRRAQAAQNAALAWRHQTSGQITVTNHGFYIQDLQGLWRWDWGSIDLLQAAGPSTVVMQGQSTRGPLTWRLFSDWAELVFVLWAHARHRQHPQYLTGEWVQPGWVQWAAAQGYPLSFGPPRPGGEVAAE